MTIEELQKDIQEMHRLHEEILENKDKHIKILEDHIIELREIIHKYILKKTDEKSSDQI